VTAKRSVVLGCGSYLPAEGPDQCRTGGPVWTRSDEGSCSVPASAGVISPLGEFTSHLAIQRRACRASTMPALMRNDRSDRAGRPRRRTHLSGDRGCSQSALGINHGVAFRPAGGMLRFRLWRWRPRQFPALQGTHKRALVIGAETFRGSSTGRPRHLRCCSATAPVAVGARGAGPAGGSADRGILTTHLRLTEGIRQRMYMSTAARP